jgi:hypothetical protein
MGWDGGILSMAHIVNESCKVSKSGSCCWLGSSWGTPKISSVWWSVSVCLNGYLFRGQDFWTHPNIRWLAINPTTYPTISLYFIGCLSENWLVILQHDHHSVTSCIFRWLSIVKLPVLLFKVTMFHHVSWLNRHFHCLTQFFCWLKHHFHYSTHLNSPVLLVKPPFSLLNRFIFVGISSNLDSTAGHYFALHRWCAELFGPAQLSRDRRSRGISA